jgi:hypothetical protein
LSFYLDSKALSRPKAVATGEQLSWIYPQGLVLSQLPETQEGFLTYDIDPDISVRLDGTDSKNL